MNQTIQNCLQQETEINQLKEILSVFLNQSEIYRNHVSAFNEKNETYQNNKINNSNSSQSKTKLIFQTERMIDDVCDLDYRNKQILRSLKSMKIHFQLIIRNINEWIEKCEQDTHNYNQLLNLFENEMIENMKEFEIRNNNYNEMISKNNLNNLNNITRNNLNNKTEYIQMHETMRSSNKNDNDIIFVDQGNEITHNDNNNDDNQFFHLIQHIKQQDEAIEEELIDVEQQESNNILYNNQTMKPLNDQNTLTNNNINQNEMNDVDSSQGEVEDEVLNQLELWTGLKCNEILFDSDDDNWAENTSIFINQISGEKQIIFLITSDQDEKFGYFLNTTIRNEFNQWIPTDSKTFHFNISSNPSQLKQSMKYEIKDCNFGGYCLYDNSNPKLISLGDLNIYKQNYKNKSFFKQNNEKFDYHGIKNAFCQKSYPINTFTPKRIVVIQMSN